MIGGLNPYPVYTDSGVPWLKQVPAHWDVRRIKTLFREKEERSGDGSGLLLSLTRARGLLPQSEASHRLASASDFSKYKVCRPGDLVMNRMQAWSGMFAVSACEGLVSPDYSVFAPIGHSDVRYFEQLFKTPVVVDQFAQASKGVGSGFNRLYSPDFGAVPVVVPPLSEQAAIVRFLDHADRQIRRYIRAKQKLIKLLEEQKQAIIHRAVTRGLDPNVRLRPSGVEWLGDVPEHWGVERTKNLFRLRTQKSGRAHGLELLSIYTHIGVRPRKDLEERGNKASTTDDYWIVRKGDLIVNKLLAWMGAVGVSEYEGVTSPAYDILMPVRPLCPAFYHYLFRTKLLLQQFKQRSRGIMDMRLRLYFDQLGQIPIVVPPVSEQFAIVAFYVEATADLDRAIETARLEIDLLREYRTRLIADVVTGKLDVREAAARLPQEADDLEPLDEAEVEGEAEENEAGDGDGAPEEADA